MSGDRFTIERPWLHETHGNPTYRWLVTNRLMRSDETGIEITYDWRRSDDVICGARTIRPGIPDFERRFPWRMDQSVDHEVVCTVRGDHGETPHIGAPADCGDMTCRCRDYGSYRLVVVGFAIKPPVSGDQQDGGDAAISSPPEGNK